MNWFPFPRKQRVMSVPDGVVLYAIGDMHGRVDLLRVLLSTLSEDLDPASSVRVILVGLGDYIDRGPRSREIVDLLIRLQATPGLETHFLRGNHEATLLNFLDNPAVGADWCAYGGREALASYGVNIQSGAEDWVRINEEFRAKLPASHLAFFQSLELKFETGDYFFVHAGARPGVALSDQDEQDLYWIREPFLSHSKPFEKIVVHGHSPDVAAYDDHRRIGIDTGAYATSVLTALRLEGTSRRLIQTHRVGPARFELKKRDL